MSLASVIQKSYDRQWCVKLKTDHPNGDTYDGVVTAIKPHFIVLQHEVDFEFDGLIVFPRSRCSGYRDRAYEKCQNEILRHNGQLRQIQYPAWIETCETLCQVLESIQEREIWPGVETLFRWRGRRQSAFFLGPITKVSHTGFSLNCYDAAGHWEKEYDFDYSKLFRIEFHSRYCNHFNRYMQRKKS